MPPPAGTIKHLVVLMLENRSFDHMFGFLKSDDYIIDMMELSNACYCNTAVLLLVKDSPRLTFCPL